MIIFEFVSKKKKKERDVVRLTRTQRIAFYTGYINGEVSMMRRDESSFTFIIFAGNDLT